MDVFSWRVLIFGYLLLVLLLLSSSTPASSDPTSASDVKYPHQYAYVVNQHNKQYQSIEQEQNHHPRFHGKRIAICVTGQVGRLLPRYMITNLILANPDYIFRVFYQLQVSSIHNTNPDPIFQPSEFTHFNDYALFKSLSHFIHQDNSRMVKLGISSGHSVDFWTKKLGIGKLDRIRQFPPHIQYTILDMYYKQVNCSHDILQYEEDNGFKFDYVILHREDIFYMGNMNLTLLLQKFTKDPERTNIYNPEPFSRNYSSPSQCNSDDHHYCDMLFKNCLGWGGVNLRLQIYRRAAALNLITSRIDFYQFMSQHWMDVHHTEQYEKLQVERMGWRACGIDVEDFAILPARITRDYMQEGNNRSVVLNETTTTLSDMTHAGHRGGHRLPDVSYQNGNNTDITGLCFLYIEVEFARLKEFCFRKEYQTFLHDHMCETHIKRMHEYEKHKPHR